MGDRYAYVNEATLVVENLVLLPSDWPNVPNAYEPPTGFEVFLSDTARIGDIYDPKTGTFIAPSA